MSVRVGSLQSEEARFQGRRGVRTKARGFIDDDLGVLPRDGTGLQGVQRGRKGTRQGVRGTDQGTRGTFADGQDTGYLGHHGRLLPLGPPRIRSRILQRVHRAHMPVHQAHLHRSQSSLSPADYRQPLQAPISKRPERIPTSGGSNVISFDKRRPVHKTVKILNKAAHRRHGSRNPGPAACAISGSMSHIQSMAGRSDKTAGAVGYGLMCGITFPLGGISVPLRRPVSGKLGADVAFLVPARFPADRQGLQQRVHNSHD